MPQIGNIPIKIEWGFFIIDDNGNTHQLPTSQAIQLPEPSPEAFQAVFERWQAERDQHRANLAEQMAQAKQGQPPRAERRRAAKQAVREATAVAAPANGKHPDTAEQPVSVEE